MDDRAGGALARRFVMVNSPQRILGRFLRVPVAADMLHTRRTASLLHHADQSVEKSEEVGILRACLPVLGLEQAADLAELLLIVA